METNEHRDDAATESFSEGQIEAIRKAVTAELMEDFWGAELQQYQIEHIAIGIVGRLWNPQDRCSE